MRLFLSVAFLRQDSFAPLLFPLRAFFLVCIFPFGRIFTPVCHFAYITVFRHFVYVILFKSLCLLRLYLMQASALPSLAAFITFGYYPDSGSIRATDNSVYVWHIYMLSPCFLLNFLRPHIFPFGRIIYARLSLCSVTLFTPFCLSHFVYCACI